MSIDLDKDLELIEAATTNGSSHSDYDEFRKRFNPVYTKQLVEALKESEAKWKRLAYLEKILNDPDTHIESIREAYKEKQELLDR